MRYTYEPLEKINIAAGENSLYIAIVIAMLYPLGSDEDAFNDAFDDLFDGHKMSANRRKLRQAFASMTRHEMPSILPELVRDYLIPRFTNYCNQ